MAKGPAINTPYVGQPEEILMRIKSADPRWTIRFADVEDLAVSHQLAQVCARHDGTTMASVIRTAIERYCANRIGPELTRVLIQISAPA